MVLAQDVARDIAETDLPMVAEVATWLTRDAIESNEARIESGLENSPAARLAFRPRRIEPGRNATIDQTVAVVSCDFNHWIVDPALLPRFRVKCEDSVERRGQVQRAIYKNGGSFQSAALLMASAIRDVADMKSPGDL